MKTNDNRVKLEEGENGNTLVILLADTKDAGEYSCQISISGGEPTEIRHSVRIRGKKRFFFYFSCRFLNPNNFIQFELKLFYFLRSEKSPGTS
jgi:hypothetical protein